MISGTAPRFIAATGVPQSIDSNSTSPKASGYWPGQRSDTTSRLHHPQLRGVVVRHDVHRMNERAPRKRLQRQPPEIRVAVHDIEPLRLLHRPAKVHPLAKLPVVRRSRRPVRARQSGDLFPVRLRSAGAKNRHMMPELDEFARQQPRERLNTAPGILADPAGNGSDLSDSHDKN